METIARMRLFGVIPEYFYFEIVTQIICFALSKLKRNKYVKGSPKDEG
jgi:hypothetical protein